MGFGRKKTYLKNFLVFVVILIIFASSVFFGYISYQKMLQRLKANYEEEIEILQVEKYMMKREVYVPIKAIKKGSILQENLVELKEIHSNISQDTFADIGDFGKQLIVGYEKDFPIFRNTLIASEVEDDYRIREISTVLLQSDLKENDVIDCRIRYANGLEFIVLSKKQVKKIDLSNNTIWLLLNEKESLLLSSALVDKAHFQGSSFYICRYIESNIQKKALVNYIPNQEVIRLIEEELGSSLSFNDSHKEKRKNIEEVLFALDEEQTAQVEEGITDEKSSVNKRVAKQDISNLEFIEETELIDEVGSHDFN